MHKPEVSPKITAALREVRAAARDLIFAASALETTYIEVRLEGTIVDNRVILLRASMMNPVRSVIVGALVLLLKAAAKTKPRLQW